jgi:sarcosine oxidase subunit beta
MLWDYQIKVMDPVWPPRMDEQYPEIALRGLATMLPRMKEYFGRMPRPQLDGGYYTKTRENRPLIGPMGVDGAYMIGAVSGYGIMSACGAGELLAAHVMGMDLPSYAPTFALSRYEDSEYTKQLENWSQSWQL